MKERIENITRMEEILDDTEMLLDKVQRVQKKWVRNRSDFAKLIDYYHNEDWQKDREDSDAGIFGNLKSGVLSEDAVYNLYSRQRELAFKMIRTALDILED